MFQWGINKNLVKTFYQNSRTRGYQGTLGREKQMNMQLWGTQKFITNPEKNNKNPFKQNSLMFKGAEINKSGRLPDVSHITPKGVILYPKKPQEQEVQKSAPMSLKDIPNAALIAKLNYVIKTSYVLPSQEPKDIKRAVAVNDKDFISLNATSVRTIQGVHPDVPLRTDDIEVTDSKIDPVVPTKSGDLLFPRDSLEFDQVNALVHASETADMINNYWDIKVPWAFDGPIKLNAHARFFNNGTGEYIETWDNAFYSRDYKEIALLIAENKREKGKVVYASRSSNTIAHEVAHAKLDGLEKYYTRSFGDPKNRPFEAIHESFADFNAILHSLGSDKVVDKILEQTNGDLKKDNLASQYGVLFGRMVLQQEKACLRNVLNNYVRPEKLSDLDHFPTENNSLTLEPHHYSQLFTGTLYDVLESIYTDNLKKYDNNQKLSFVKSRDTVGRLFNRALLYMPVSEVDFKDVAYAMLKVDKVENNGANYNSLVKCFLKRNILKKDDIIAFIQKQNDLPALKLNVPIITGTVMENFVEQNKAALGLNKDTKFEFYRCLIDSNGNQFFKMSKKSKLSIPDDRSKFFDMANKEDTVRDGITLVFDYNGNLISSLSKELTTDDKEEIFKVLDKFAQLYYKSRQDGYDEVKEEWDKRQKQIEEARKKNTIAKANEYSSIHTLDSEV